MTKYYGLSSSEFKTVTLVCTFFSDAPENIELSDETLVLREGISSEKVVCSSQAYPEANYFWTFNDQVKMDV